MTSGLLACLHILEINCFLPQSPTSCALSIDPLPILSPPPLLFFPIPTHLPQASHPLVDYWEARAPLSLEVKSKVTEWRSWSWCPKHWCFFTFPWQHTHYLRSGSTLAAWRSMWKSYWYCKQTQHKTNSVAMATLWSLMLAAINVEVAVVNAHNLRLNELEYQQTMWIIWCLTSSADTPFATC